ncbi:MAG: LamG-like jellyroll fold domain-containing protein [Sedimentisphaeraceae bacterium JB056]
MRSNLLIFVVLLAVSMAANGADYYFNDSVGDHDWNTSSNWSPSGPPSGSDIAYFDEDYEVTGNYCLIEEGDNVTCARLRMSSYNTASKQTYIKMTGGTITATSGISLGNHHFYDSSFYAARFEQLGGDVICNDFWRVGYRTGLSEWYLLDGMVTCNRLLLQTTDAATYSKIYVGNGTFSLKGNVKATMEALVGTTIIPYNNEGDIVVTYDASARGGLGETVVSRVAKAGSPSPANGAEDATSDLTLTWAAGPGSVSSDVYFGVDYDAVVHADTSSPEFFGNQANADYSLTGLVHGQSYYWRIDAVLADSSVVRGTTWSFTVSNSMLIEDFESYGNDSDIQLVWGADAALDLATIYNSTQALDLFFEHTSAAQTTSVSRMFSPAQDWSEPGIVALAMDVYGDANEIDTLYLSISDGVNQGVVYYTDVTDLYADFNQEYKGWNIDLADITGAGVDLSNVVSIEFGFSGVGRGTVLFDNITLYASRCVPDFFPGDVTGDCTADMDDIMYYISDWLEQSGTIVAGSVPSDPVVYYNFDETSGYTAADSSGNGFDGVTTDLAAHWLPSQGVNGGCLELDGASGVSVPLEVFDSNSITQQTTVAFWINGDAATYPSQERYDFTFLATHNNGDRIVVILPYKNGNVFWRTHLNSAATNGVTWVSSVPSDWAGQWNHYAFTKDISTGVMGIYRNGELVARAYENYDEIAHVAPVTDCFIGCLNSSGSNAHIGMMDDFMIFDRVLSQEEILALAGQSQIVQPSISVADVNDDDVVNIKDYASMASQWLNEQTTWPF